MMVDLNFNEMTVEEIDSFCEKYLVIFQKVCDDLVNKQQSLISLVGGDSIEAMKAYTSPLAKIWFMVKKVIKNAFISTATGIETMHLDNDTTPIVKKGVSYYMRQNMIILIYTCEKRLEKATRELLRILNSEKVYDKRDILTKIDKFYRECYGVDYGSGKKNDDGSDKEYGIVLAALLRDIFSEPELADMTYAAYKRGTSIPPQYDFFKDVCDVYANFAEDKA